MVGNNHGLGKKKIENVVRFGTVGQETIAG